MAAPLDSLAADLRAALPSTAPAAATTFRLPDDTNAAGDRRAELDPLVSPSLSLSVTRAQAARQRGSYLVEDARSDIPAIAAEDLARVTALRIVGKPFPALEREAKFLARQVVAALARRFAWVLLSEDRVQFPNEGPKPDTFMMDADNDLGDGKVPSSRAWAECAGLLEWKAPAVSANSGQPAQYIEQMLSACPWRESAVVITFGIDTVQVHVGCAWRHGRHRLRILRSARRKVFAADTGSNMITKLDKEGLALLAWGLGEMASARLPLDLAHAIGISPPGADVVTYAGSPSRLGPHAKLVGVGTSSSVCAFRPHDGEDVLCVKTVRRTYARHFATELAALQVLPRRASFPALVGSDEDTRRIVTTPFANPLCPVTGERPRRICVLGFAAYAPLVEDLKALHIPPEGSKQVFHCDVAPHNLAWYPSPQNGERRVLLLDFGCAVVADEPSQTTVPYSGSMWYASSAALEQLTADRGEGVETNTWAGEVRVDASFDLESLAKSVAALEVPRVADFIDDEAQRLCKARKQSSGWSGFRPRDVKDLWERAFAQLPDLRALAPLFDAARRGDHDAMAAELRALRVCVVRS